mmetsp:Transcript_1177/g.1843  ORF Transcript_1177/g.1843 Transcript_1177/m.1843 type:complete len:91 (-) Transcript_1177:1054-1326(-)
MQKKHQNMSHQFIENKSHLQSAQTNHQFTLLTHAMCFFVVAKLLNLFFLFGGATQETKKNQQQPKPKQKGGHEQRFACISTSFSTKSSPS